MKAVLLVGGEGSRLRPLTCKTPKAMVPILNRPFLEHFIARLEKHNVKDIILTLGYLPSQVQAYLGDGRNLGVKLIYVLEEAPLGTAGAVKNVAQYLDATFFVFNGDVFTDLDLTRMLAFHRKREAVATIALTPVEDPSRYGVVETSDQGRVRAFVEKPPRHEATTNMINAGTYILEPEVLKYIPSGSYYMFERGLFPLLLVRERPVYAYPSDAYWIDIGTPENYFQLHLDLLGGKASTALSVPADHRGCSIHPSAQLERPVLMGEGCIIGPRVQLNGPVVLGPGCVIGEEVLIEQSVLWHRVRVGARARLSQCVVAADCYIGDSCYLSRGCVLGEAVELKAGSRLEPGTRLQADKRSHISAALQKNQPDASI
jgi:mannose-1-phosphate guanylyltransferase